jgi:hypothetical protein
VLFPTPPLPLATATTFFTFGMPRLSGRPRRGIIGGSPCFGSPCEKRISARELEKRLCYNTRGLSWRKVRKVLKRRCTLGMVIMGYRKWPGANDHNASFSLSHSLSRIMSVVLFLFFLSTFLNWCSVIIGHLRDRLERSPPLRRVRMAPLRPRSLCASLSHCYRSSKCPS